MRLLLHYPTACRRITAVVLFEMGLAAAGVWQGSAADGEELDTALLKNAQEVFAPLPSDMATPTRPITPEQANLGRMLFFDPRASVDGTVSCSRCHQPALYGTDGLQKSRGAHDKMLPRNAPTVFNAALQFKAHWDGVNDDVEMQARRSLTGLGFAEPDSEAGLAKIRAIPGYPELFKQAFPADKESVTLEQWATAIGAFERTLVSPSRFDDYLRGKTGALSDGERQGLRTFIGVGCAECHHGPDIGGTEFEKFGVFADYWTETHSDEIDTGRFDVTHSDDDLYVFKVPSLRNVAKTPPYFHDGSVGNLSDAVHIMSKLQLDKELSDAEAQSIVVFLEGLTGDVPPNFQAAPVLPSAGFQLTSPEP